MIEPTTKLPFELEAAKFNRLIHLLYNNVVGVPAAEVMPLINELTQQAQTAAEEHTRGGNGLSPYPAEEHGAHG